MKKLIGFILTLIAVNSFAGKIPEAKKLHPELYTIQFTFARFPTMDSIFMTNKERNRAYGEYENFLEELEDEGELESEEYENLLEELGSEEQLEDEDREMARSLLYGRVMHKALINHIESSKEVEYIDLATIYTRSGERFTEANSKVKGLLDVESKTLDIFEYNFPKESDNTKSTIIRLRLNKWYDGGWSQYGDWKNPGYLLIKCYPPTNVSSNQKLDPSAVKTSGDPVNEQGTAAERYTIQVARLNYYDLEHYEKEGLLTEKQIDLLDEIKDKMRREIEKHQNLLEDLVDEKEIEEAETLHRWRMQALDIKRAEVLKQGYTEIATIYTSPGKPFSGEYGIKGILDVASNKIIFTDDNDLFGGKDLEFPIYANEWTYITHKFKGIDRYCLLVKYYPSANVPSSETSE
ncbi:MAG: hypothetical protein GXY61_11040 [Lentisphaerae bacterium]|nr:hypothetical protein [Lentisphaerota bacterium]